jgi:(p)ppGpp synthase/HD superfamily hydrolase
MESLLEKAKLLAYEKHKFQMYDKKNNIPYTYHLEEVVSIVRCFGETAVIIAYLHDIVEDTDVTIEEIKNIFGEFISECVYFVTDENADNRVERKILTNNKLNNVQKSHNIALIVKAADRLANINESFISQNTKYFNRYISEYPEFKKSVKRECFADDLWLHLDYFHKLSL